MNQSSAGSSFSLASTIVYYMPTYIASALTISALGINVSTAGAGMTADIALYNMVDGKPGARLAVVGPFNVASTGIKTVADLSIAVQPGWHFFAVRGSGPVTATLTAPAAAAIYPFTGMPAATPNISLSNASFFHNASLGLPDPAPAESMSASVVSGPLVFFRVA